MREEESIRQALCCAGLVLLLAASSEGAFEHSQVGARAVSLGGAYVALAQGPEATYWNPAGPADARGVAASCSYSYPFGLAELAVSSGCVVVGSKAGCFSAGVITHGFELYREVTVSLGYANAVTPGLAGGLSVKASRLVIEDFGSAHAFSLDLGLLASVAGRFRWGAAAWNVLGTSVGDEPLGQAVAVGAAFYPQERLALCVDARKDLQRPLQIQCGAEYELDDQAVIRVGVGDAPTRFSSGIGVRWGAWCLDYAVSTHLVLGLSHCVSIGIR